MLETAAAKIYGKREIAKKQNLMTEDILEVMEVRCNFKHDKLRNVELTKKIRTRILRKFFQRNWRI